MKRQPPHPRSGDDSPAGERGSDGGLKKGKGRGRWGGGSRRRNDQRLGGGGGGALSLAAFASAKSRTSGYNPALIKKQKEFYKNAKLISKYKKTKKQQSQSNNHPEIPVHEDGGDTARYVPKPHHKGKKHTVHSLKEEYEKKRAEEEKAKEERDAMVQAKREHREKSEAKRKELREKMFKKTRSGQPVMRYRIEHLLETALSK
ncbi:hypothetical protein Zm00014a_013541 [Zea mays]|uniref:rRNA-processing protein FYV7 n=2 Tax=Zea mays TaxID=4577 RepID=B6TGY6_MAIZE|nr:hypothetical protein [Zea mays]PWZ45222.1 hypothetical protein Zm00014a_013541 [Zea mays]